MSGKLLPLALRCAAVAVVGFVVYTLLKFVTAFVRCQLRRARYYANVPTLFERRLPAFTPQLDNNYLQMVWRDAATRGGVIRPAFTMTPFAGRSHVNVVFTKPEDIRTVLVNSKPGGFSKPTTLKQFTSRLLGEGLVVSEGERWHNQRKLLTPLFHFAQLKRVAPVVTAEVVRSMPMFEELLGGADYVSPVELLEQVTLRVIVSVSFGAELDADKMCGMWHRCTRATRSYVAGLILFGTLFERMSFVKASRDFIAPLDTIRAQVRELALRRYEELVANKDKHDDDAAAANSDGKQASTSAALRDAAVDAALGGAGHDLATGEYTTSAGDGSVTGSDLLQCMLRAIVERGAPIDVQQVEDEAMTFLLAGHETSSTLLAWALYYVSSLPDVQATAQRELDSVLGAKRDVLIDDLPNLPYLRGILNEALRLRPPVLQLQRIADRDFDMPCGVTLKQGDMASISFVMLHTDAATWDDPFAFKPERWTSEADSKRSAFAFCPFSAGPRNCIGSKFALQESAIFLATLLQRFAFTIDPTSNVFIKPVLTAQPGDFRVRLEKRHQ